MANRKTITIILILAIFFGAAGVGYFIYRPDLSKLAITLSWLRASNEPSFSFQTSGGLNIMPGEEFTVGLNLDTGNQKVSAVELHLKWSSNLEASSYSILADGFLPVQLPGSYISDAEKGGTIILGANPDDPKTGTGQLVTLKMKIMSGSGASVELTPDTKVAALYSAGNVQSNSTPLSLIVATPTPTPTPIAGATYGIIESANCDTITGWVLDKSPVAQPTSQLEVAILKDRSYRNGGEMVYDGITDQERSDINALFNVSGQHGFSISVPSIVKDGNYHDLFMYAQDMSGTWRRLPFSGGLTPSVQCTPPPISLNQAGYVDGLTSDGQAITGWAVESPDGPTEIYIKFSRRILPGIYKYEGYVRQTTNLVRKDVNSAYGISGPHGFKYPLFYMPDEFKDGRDYKLEFVVRNGQRLSNSPLYLSAEQIQNAKPGDPGKWDGLIEQIADMIRNNSDFSGAVQKAIDYGLVVTQDSGDNTAFNLTIFNPEIPGQILLDVNVQSDLTIGASLTALNYRFAVCDNAAIGPVIMALSRPQAVSAENISVSVNCNPNDLYCVNTLIPNLKLALDSLNNFLKQVDNSYVNVTTPRFQFVSPYPTTSFVINARSPGDNKGRPIKNAIMSATSVMTRQDVKRFIDDPNAREIKTTGGRIDVYEDRAKNYNNLELQYLFIHEFLHTLGLADSGDSASIMYKFQNTNKPDILVKQTLSQIYSTSKYNVQSCESFNSYYQNLEGASWGSDNSPEIEAPSVSQWNVYDWLLQFYTTLPYFSPPPDDVTPVVDVGFCVKLPSGEDSCK